MKLTCTRDNLYRGLSVTSHLGGKQVDLPILGNVLMKAGGGSLTLTATNLEIASSCLVRGKVDRDGEFTVPAKLFFDFVSLLPSEQVDLEVVDDVLQVRSGGFSTKINGLSASEFPLIPTLQDGQMYKFSASELREGITGALFAVSTNESRPELSGVSLRVHDAAVGTGKATLAATDSYRLSERIVDVQGSSEARAVIIPARTLAEVSRVISVSKDDVDTPEQIEVTIAENQILFRFGSIEIVSRTIDGRYPDYRQIIPTAFKTDAKFEVGTLIKAIKTASLFSRTGLFDITLTFTPSKKVISVRGADTTRGENVGECPAELAGVDNAVTVNYRYLLDGLQALAEPEATLQVIDGGNPCLLLPASDAAKKRSQYIVMPIKQ